MKIWLVIPIAIIGDVLGDNIGFLIGRFGGRPLVEKYGRYVRIDKNKLDAMESLFREKGGRTVYTAHFFSTTRITAALIAGISHMPYKKFLGFNLAAAATFVTLVATITYYFGKNLDAVLRFFHIFRLVGFSVVALIVVTYLFRYYRKKKQVHKHLGKKLIAGIVVVTTLLGFFYYFITGALIVLPRTGEQAGLTHGILAQVSVDVEQGFISDAQNNALFITAMGEPKLTLGEDPEQKRTRVTFRNVDARNSDIQSSTPVEKLLITDDLSLSFDITPQPSAKTVVTLTPKAQTGQYYFTVTGDTRDAGMIFPKLLDSINGKPSAFMIHAGDFVKDGEKRKYRSFLDQVGSLKEPLYTGIGEHETIDRGKPLYKELFGPENHSFTYQNSRFIFLDTSDQPPDLDWLAKELIQSKGSQNIFLITYEAPLDSSQFVDLVTSAGVKAVYSIKAAGNYQPAIKGTNFELFEHGPEDRYFYTLVHVSGNSISEDKITIDPSDLSFLDRIVQKYVEIKREIINSFSR